MCSQVPKNIGLSRCAKQYKFCSQKKSLGDDPLEWLPAVDAEHQTHCVRACVGTKLCALALALDAMYDTMYAKNGFGVFWLGQAACDREGKTMHIAMHTSE